MGRGERAGSYRNAAKNLSIITSLSWSFIPQKYKLCSESPGILVMTVNVRYPPGSGPFEPCAVRL